jgi:hypothetical protein
VTTNRPKDLCWEALIEVTGANVSMERGALNASLKEIRDEMPDVDAVDLAGEIVYRAGLYRKAFPGAALTPTALAKHWTRVLTEGRATPALAAPAAPQSRCTLCRDNGWVFVQDTDDTAPCPSCLKGSRAEKAGYGHEGAFWGKHTWAHGRIPGEVVLS